MIQKDPKEIKNRIIQILNSKGAMLPVYISKEIGLESLFTSAFLSELVSERKIRVSNMRVGNSPIYFTNEKVEDLERFGFYLNSKEKEAFMILKENKFLEDEKQEPAIRVALQHIKDFAIPFNSEGKLIWRYFTISESEFKKEVSKVEEKKPKEMEVLNKKLKEKKQESLIQRQRMNKKENDEEPGKFLTKKTKQKAKNNFFDKVKEFLSGKNIEIIGIESFNNKELFLKIKENNQERILAAFNKKKITEKDFLKAYRKSREANLTYLMLALEESSKKISNFVEAIKKLERIESLNKNI